MISDTEKNRTKGPITDLWDQNFPLWMLICGLSIVLGIARIGLFVTLCMRGLQSSVARPLVILTLVFWGVAMLSAGAFLSIEATGGRFPEMSVVLRLVWSLTVLGLLVTLSILVAKSNTLRSLAVLALVFWGGGMLCELFLLVDFGLLPIPFLPTGMGLLPGINVLALGVGLLSVEWLTRKLLRLA